MRRMFKSLESNKITSSIEHEPDSIPKLSQWEIGGAIGKEMIESKIKKGWEELNY